MANLTHSQLVALINSTGVIPVEEGWVCTYPISLGKWCQEDAPHKIPHTEQGLCPLHYNEILMSVVPQTGIADGTVYRGMGASPGIAEGICFIVSYGTRYDEKLPEESVLITTMTTPELVGMMRDAVAIVTSRGGRLCHAAIVSREFRVPCVVGMAGLDYREMVRLKGKRVRIDGKAGTMEVLNA